MFIKKLEVQGFKSFADRTKVLFHPGITAIVGPNGTGKSNIVDAILWGLGGMRLKSVRVDRTEDVIFNGNTKRSPLSMAEVVITLGNEEELVISHRVFRSGESEYRLNGKAVRLKDIQDELWKHSIGEKEYFVIEQGAIGSFVTSKPQEKRALIEEAAGTAYYKDKKRQAQSKLESSEQNLIRLEDIIIEVEKAKNSLYRQALAAARYRRLRERLRELTSHHFYRRMKHLDLQIAEAQAQLDQAWNQEQLLSAQVKEEEKILAGQRKELWDLEKTLKEKQEKVFALKSQLSRLESEIERESKNLEYLELSRKRAEADRKDLEEEIKTIEAERDQILRQLQELEQNLVLKVQEAERKRTQLEEARKQVSEAEARLAEVRKEQLQTIQENTEARNNYFRLEKELELFFKQAEKLKQEKTRAEAQKEELLFRLETINQQIEEHQQIRNHLEQQINEQTSLLSAISAEIKELDKNLGLLNREIDEITYQLQALEKITEAERDSSSTDLLPEALGWFSDLVEVPAEEAPLFDLFWKEEGKAQAILAENFLRQRPAEIRGHLLLLSETNSPDVPEELIKEEGVLGLLKNKIKVKDNLEKYLKALEDAVIVSDLLKAVQLWQRFPAFNYLTPAGEVLYSSGLLKTGQKKEGLFALAQEKKRLKQEIEKKQLQTSPLLQAREEKKHLQSELDNRVQKLRDELSAIERRLYDLQKEKKYTEDNLSRLNVSLDIIEKEEKIQEQERQELLARKEKASAITGEIEARLENIRDRMRQEEENLEKAKGREKAEEQEYYQARSERDLLKERINGARASVESLEKRVQSIKTKMGQLEMDLMTGEEETVNLTHLLEELEQKRRKLSEETSAEEEKLKEFEVQVQSKQKDLEELESKLQELRKKEEEAREQRVKLEIRKAEAERDRINLEETCWQELKKNLVELKQEMEAAEQPAEAPAAENEEIARALSEEGEEAEEETEEKQEEIEEKAEEKPRERRRVKPFIPARELSDEELEKELENIRETLQKYRAVNLMAEEEFLEQKKRYDFLIKQRQDLRESIHSTQEAIKKIDEESKNQFLKALEEVNKNFQELFALLFRGGTAEVKLLEPDNPLESGVEIIAQPPGKRVQNLTLLSGGEKSLTSLAFLFALFRYKPSPFCILDEVDAALDEVNLTRFLNLMKTIKHQTQFIIITHNYKTMEVADYIYGTTMEEPNVTKIYSVRMEKKETTSETLETEEASRIENLPFKEQTTVESKPLAPEEGQNSTEDVIEEFPETEGNKKTTSENPKDNPGSASGQAE
ncbi:MAG: chromosome segregation protein SMC [Candidatus Aminicenantes bacterium]|nr:chromosome segregation protein SMC [Candidatus Aminicenantes bacterium]